MLPGALIHAFVAGLQLQHLPFQYGVARLQFFIDAGLLLDLVAGTYVVGARTFLGDELVPVATTTVPGRVVVGETPRPEASGAENEGSGTRAPRALPARRSD